MTRRVCVALTAANPNEEKTVFYDNGAFAAGTYMNSGCSVPSLLIAKQSISYAGKSHNHFQTRTPLPHYPSW
jgi:hypothetical protein